MTAAIPPQTEPDHELLRRVTQGHTDAFTELFRRRRGEVFRFATHMTGSCQVGEDVLQDVFLVVMRDAGRYDAARASVSAWLCGIARNCVRQRLSGDRRYQSLTADDEVDAAGPIDHQESPLDQLVRQERADFLRAAIRALPLAYREALVLCDLQEQSYGDAATASRLSDRDRPIAAAPRQGDAGGGAVGEPVGRHARRRGIGPGGRTRRGRLQGVFRMTCQ